MGQWDNMRTILKVLERPDGEKIMKEMKGIPTRLLKKMMKQLEKGEITRDEMLDQFKEQGYWVQTIDPAERYVVDGKFLIALFDTIAMIGRKSS